MQENKDLSEQRLDDSQGECFANRYQVTQLLGKKAGRQTWRATDQQTQAEVVIKLLTFGSDFQWDDLKLFEREAATLRSLDHPAIPRYLDFFEFDRPNPKGFALVQTYIAAHSLEDHLKSGRSFSEAEVKQLARELLEILDYLHSRQPPVIHRDIKPSNILLTNRSGNTPGKVYLVDFGSVQTLAAREGGTITVVGTYGYMPPEQFGGRAVPASDLYSLGATLIRLITGQHPADLPQTDLRLDFAAFASLSPRLNDWLQWLTEPSLSKRPTTAKSALAELTQLPSWSGRKADRSPSQQALRPPAHSRIQLTRERKFLEIILPSRRLRLPNPLTWWTIVIAIVFPYFIFLWLVLAVLIWLLGALFGQTRVVIDRQNIAITRRLFGLSLGNTRQMPQRHLWKLELPTGRRPYLRLWIGTQKCEIYGDRGEINWLSAELSDWLGLPLE